MKSAAVVALALLESAQGLQVGAAGVRAVSRASAPAMFAEGSIGVTPPLGVYDPLGLIETRDMRRFEIMEIKHGRAAMFGFLHIVLIHAGVRFPGYLSIEQDIKFVDMPVGCFASLEAVPTLGWLQIMPVPRSASPSRPTTRRRATLAARAGSATMTRRRR